MFKNPTTYGPTLKISQQLHSEKYRLPGETFEQSMVRVAKALADKGNMRHEEDVLDILLEQRFLPAGRVQTGAGSGREVTLYNCLTGDTKILTKEFGSIPIKDVVNQTVHLLDGNLTWTLCKIFNHGEQEVVDLVFKNGFESVVVSSTLDHGWVTPSKKKVVLTRSFTSEFGKSSVGYLRVNKEVDTSSEDYKKGVFHGLIYGDGTVHEGGQHHIRVCAHHESVLPYLSFGSISYPPSQEGDPLVYISRDKSWTNFKQFPDMAVASQEYLLGFLRGWFAADGCVSTQPEATLCCDDVEQKWLEQWGPLVGWHVRGHTILSKETNFGPRKKNSRNVRLKTYAMVREDFLIEEHAIRWVHRQDDEWRVHGTYSNKRKETVYCPYVPTTNSFALANGIHSRNCFVSGDIHDNFTNNGGIMQRATEAAETMRRGGGVGYNFGSIRPRGTPIKTLGSAASGPISFMHIFDAVCKTVSSAGHRRGAQMGILPVSHPDIFEFVEAKQNTHALTAFNISVGITDDFMEALVQKKPYTLRFENVPYKTINPEDLWNKIMMSTWDYAEPGVIFLDRINDMNNLWYCEKIEATNPCVPAGTPILTDKGYVNIDDVMGHKVNVWNGVAFTETVPFVSGYNKNLHFVVLSDGRYLECTPNHEFVMRDGTRKKADDLEVGDFLTKWNAPIIPGGIYAEGMYQQGFYSGDGWIDNRRRQYIGLYGEKKKLVDKFKYQTIHEYDISGGYEGTNLDETRIYLKVEDMLSKSFVPFVPHDIRTRLEWFAGLCDSDGTVSRSNSNSVSLQVSSKDKNFLDNVALMLNTLGVIPTVNKANTCFRLTVTATDLNTLIGLGFVTHRLDISNNNPDRDARRFPKVVSVEKNVRAVGEVYCFTESEFHQGVFNGILTGQCSEQPLPPNGACLLGSFNLVKYINLDRETEKWAFNYAKLCGDIQTIVRAMDNVVDISLYPLEAQREEAHAKRRMGLGITGFANASEILGKPYGSEKSKEFLRAVLKVLMEMSYHTSAMLAKEKGAFPLFDKKKYLQGKFIQKLSPETRKLIEQYGIRNSHLISIAPTGTISLCADNVSSGIEPVFSYGYERTIVTPDGPIVEFMSDYAYREYGVKGKTADSLTAKEHLEVLLVAQEYTDSAVSKTCNVSPEMPWEEFKDLYLQAWKGGAKGLSTFNVGGKRMGILTAKKEKEDEPEVAGEACYIDPLTGTKSCG